MTGHRRIWILPDGRILIYQYSSLGLTEPKNSIVVFLYKHACLIGLIAKDCETYRLKEITKHPHWVFLFF
jgi:hypothetical protein